MLSEASIWVISIKWEQIKLKRKSLKNIQNSTEYAEKVNILFVARGSKDTNVIQITGL